MTSGLFMHAQALDFRMRKEVLSTDILSRLIGWGELCPSSCGDSYALYSSVSAPEFVFEHGYQTYLPTESTDNQTATVISLPTKSRTKKPTAPPAQKRLGCCYPGKGSAMHRMCRKGFFIGFVLMVGRRRPGSVDETDLEFTIYLW
jgi:hypothetical protein